MSDPHGHTATETDHAHADHGHDDHGHAAHGHDDHGHDDHGHDAHGHDDHGDHGHHAPPAPRYIVLPPAEMGDVSVKSWVAYVIFAVVVLLIAILMLATVGR